MDTTPAIAYLSGDSLLLFDESWYAQVEAITRAEVHLLTKTREDLEPAARNGRVIIAVDTSAGNRVVGCIVLWELDRDADGVMWYELGTFLVSPEYRFGSDSPKAMPIGDALYRRLLAEHQDKNTLGTTTNRAAIKTGRRHGMQMISFGRLPIAIHRATCICPIEKTGVADQMRCRIKDQLCRVRVSYETWLRMDQPVRLAWTA